MSKPGLIQRSVFRLTKSLRAGVLFASALPSFTFADAPGYTNDFESQAIGEPPKDLLVISGAFSVQADGGNKFLELPGAPLDTFGALFGPMGKDGGNVSAKFYATKVGRKFPAFGLSLNGAGGYRLQVSAGKRMIEIFKGDEVLSSVAFAWQDAAWLRLRIQARKTPAGAWVIEGKAWPAATAEPDQWNIALEQKDAPTAGRPGIWGSPFSGTQIRFDDLAVVPQP